MKLMDAIRTMLYKEKKQSNHQLYTMWGENLDPEQVLPEYPRPQLRRDNYTILNGYWNYKITQEITKPSSFEGVILVPFSPESALSGVNRQLKPEEYLWYERTFELPRKQPEKRCILHFGAVDQFCEVFINNEKVAQHMGGYLPFSIDITKECNEGGNLLTLKVVDLSDSSYHSRGKQKLTRGGMFYTAQSGIWQTVWMEWVPDCYITSIKITPLVEESSVRLEIKRNCGSLYRKIVVPEETDQGNRPVEMLEAEEELYQVDIYAENQLLQSITSNLPDITIPMKEFIFWSPENPFLYDVVISAGKDRVVSYFAMRCFEIKKDKEGISRFFLNKEPYFQKGLLDQGYWPDGLYTAPKDEAMIFDIVQAKELGFNMLRKHIKIEPLRWYYHCDRLGVIVWQDMVNGGGKYNTLLVGYLPTLFPKLAYHISDQHYHWLSRSNKEGRREWTGECIETVQLLYNCPSVAVWVPFNEGWGQFDAKKAVELIREADSTRLIDHASGWFDQKVGDFNSVHNYFHPFEVKPEHRSTVLSEFGGFACYIPGHSFSWQIYGYRIYLTKEDFNEAYQSLFQNEIDRLIRIGLSAAVYTQLSDVEDEVNGLFTYDRKICKVKK